jgi:hypothetical protein
MRNDIWMNADTRTHEKLYPISIFLPALDHLVVFNVCSIIIYGEERRRAVTGIGLSLIQWRLRMVAVVIYYRRQWDEQEKGEEDKGDTYRGSSRPRCLGDQFETLMEMLCDSRQSPANASELVRLPVGSRTCTTDVPEPRMGAGPVSFSYICIV